MQVQAESGSTAVSAADCSQQAHAGGAAAAGEQREARQAAQVPSAAGTAPAPKVDSPGVGRCRRQTVRPLNRWIASMPSSADRCRAARHMARPHSAGPANHGAGSANHALFADCSMHQQTALLCAWCSAPISLTQVGHHDIRRQLWLPVAAGAPRATALGGALDHLQVRPAKAGGV